jgi:hypothetical protein
MATSFDWMKLATYYINLEKERVVPQQLQSEDADYWIWLTKYRT